MKKIIKFADLCSGIGGFRLASKKIISKNFKLKHIIASDIDDKCELFISQYLDQMMHLKKM